MRLGLGLAFLLLACGDPTTPSGSDAGALDARGHVCANDAECDDELFCNGEERCMPGATGADASGCVPGPDACAPPTDVCDEDADECLGPCDVAPDADGDGVRSTTCGGGDCDDEDPERAPGNTEVCDVLAHDEDCDPRTFGVRDDDDDDVADARCCNVDAAGELACGRDCDDAAPTTHPTAPEVCDGFDQDCDGSIDERVQRTFYPDVDGDNYGDRDADPIEACDPPPDTVEDDHGDCDDAMMGIHPGAVEICTPAGVDENCSGVPDEGCMCTGTGRPCPAAVGACAAGSQPCLGTMWGECSIRPVDEICNGEDDDCNGMTDDGVGLECWSDFDRDGRSLPGSGDVVCEAVGGGCPGGSTATPPTPSAYDCADADAGSLGMAFFCYDDDDGDGYAAAAPASVVVCNTTGATCPAGTVRTATPTDCDDGDSAIAPGAAEVCNGRDDDCDGRLDECATLMNAIRACMGGACVQTSCVAGYGDCNGSPADGCEADVRRDVANCGGCGIECGTDEGCCGSTCTSLHTRDNCGSCGVRCPAGAPACCGLEDPPSCVPVIACE